MCGIGGFRRYGPEPINIDSVQQMFAGLVTRGAHAAGISLQHPDGKIYTLKEEGSALKLMAGDDWDKFTQEYLPDAVICLLHTRFATQGSPSKMENNHPLTQGHVCVTHNGCISNDNTLFDTLKLERKAEVDSDVIRAILDKYGFTHTAVDALENMIGSAAIAAISPEEPGKLLLLRSGNPIITAVDGQMFMWASEKRYIHAASRPYFEWKGMWFQRNQATAGFMTFANDSAELLGDEGKIWQRQFKMFGWAAGGNYATVNDTWRRGRARWQKDKLPEHIVCRDVACGAVNMLTVYQRERCLTDLVCGGCGIPLQEKQDKEIVESK